MRGLHKESKAYEYFTFTPSHTRAEKLAGAVGGTAVRDVRDLKNKDFYLIACQPQQFDELATMLHGVLTEESVAISVLGGLTIGHLLQKLSPCRYVARAMPNTPCMVGEGVTALSFSKELRDRDKMVVSDIFSAVSRVFVFDDEDQIDIITGVSGCGPAYIFEFARLMIDKLREMGIDERYVESMVKQTFYGSSKLMTDTPASPEKLRNEVTTEGGITARAMIAFEEMNLKRAIETAVDLAYARAKELA
ncbi:MAG: hypothetical protein A2289_03910 [Deltaproteobacteria bacterium RIFOXYA12_FULL_58_15]|nr:MAG: hypothetical protein A2289_03910 [Deltaproteobacteria bacterium RIFOXYA12_FULL_58_15]